MRRPILKFLLLVLGVFFDSARDIIHVKPRFSKNLLKQSFELRPRQRNFSAKEQSYKQGTVGTSGTGGIEMVFALLTEVVALQVVLSIIEVWKPSFEGTFLRALLPASGLNRKELVHPKLRDLLKVFRGIRGGRGSGRRSGSLS